MRHVPRDKAERNILISAVTEVGRTWKVQQGKVRQLIHKELVTHEPQSHEATDGYQELKRPLQPPQKSPSTLQSLWDRCPTPVPALGAGQHRTSFQMTDRTQAGLQEQHNVLPLLLSSLAHSLGKGKGI